MKWQTTKDGKHKVALLDDEGNVLIKAKGYINGSAVLEVDDRIVWLLEEIEDERILPEKN